MYQLSNAQIFDLFDDMDKKIQELCDDLLKYLDANADLSQIRNLETRKTPKPSRLHGAYAFGALAVLGVGGWAYLQFQKHQHNVIEPSQIALPSASTVTASITQHQGPPPIAPLAKDATSAPKKSLGLTVPSLSVAPVLPPVSATGAEPVTAPKPEIIVPPREQVITNESKLFTNLTAPVATSFPNAKIVSWLPFGGRASGPPPDFLTSSSANWRIVGAPISSLELSIALSHVTPAAIDHVNVQLSEVSQVAVLPTNVIISLSDDANADNDTFRDVSNCSLLRTEITKCAFASQYANAIKLVFYSSGKEVQNTILILGY